MVALPFLKRRIQRINLAQRNRPNFAYMRWRDLNFRAPGPMDQGFIGPVQRQYGPLRYSEGRAVDDFGRGMSYPKFQDYGFSGYRSGQKVNVVSPDRSAVKSRVKGLKRSLKRDKVLGPNLPDRWRKTRAVVVDSIPTLAEARAIADEDQKRFREAFTGVKYKKRGWVSVHPKGDLYTSRTI